MGEVVIGPDVDISDLPTGDLPAVARAGQDASLNTLPVSPDAVLPLHRGINSATARVTQHVLLSQLHVLRRSGVTLAEPAGASLIHPANFTAGGQPIRDISHVLSPKEMRTIVLGRAWQAAEAVTPTSGISPREQFRRIWHNPSGREDMKRLYSTWYEKHTNGTINIPFADYFAQQYSRAYANYLAAYRSGYMQVDINAQALGQLRMLDAATADTERYLVDLQRQAESQYYSATMKTPDVDGEQRRRLNAETERLNGLRLRNQAAYNAERPRLLAELARVEPAPVKPGRVSIRRLVAHGIMLAVAARNTTLHPGASWTARVAQTAQQMQARHELGEPVRNYIERNEIQRANSIIALQSIRLAMVIRDRNTLRVTQRHERGVLAGQPHADQDHFEEWLRAHSDLDPRRMSAIRGDRQRMAALRLAEMEARHSREWELFNKRHRSALHPQKPAVLRSEARHNIATRTRNYQLRRGALAGYKLLPFTRRPLDYVLRRLTK